MRITSLLVVSTLCVGACGKDTAKLEAAGEALLSAADDCLLSVRDRHMKYDDSPICKSLSSLSYTYLRYQAEADMIKDTPARIELLFVKAQRSAWIARAISDSNGLAGSIW